jgi:hypothetical protein
MLVGLSLKENMFLTLGSGRSGRLVRNRIMDTCKRSWPDEYKRKMPGEQGVRHGEKHV